MKSIVLHLKPSFDPAFTLRTVWNPTEAAMTVQCSKQRIQQTVVLSSETIAVLDALRALVFSCAQRRSGGIDGMSVDGEYTDEHSVSHSFTMWSPRENDPGHALLTTLLRVGLQHNFELLAQTLLCYGCSYLSSVYPVLKRGNPRPIVLLCSPSLGPVGPWLREHVPNDRPIDVECSAIQNVGPSCAVETLETLNSVCRVVCWKVHGRLIPTLRQLGVAEQAIVTYGARVTPDIFSPL